MNKKLAKYLTRKAGSVVTPKTARAILGTAVQADGSLYTLGPYINWPLSDTTIYLEGSFTMDELVAIVVHVKATNHMRATKP